MTRRMQQAERELIRGMRDSARSCAFCGTTNNLAVDHMVPRSWMLHKERADKDNLQILCHSCNGLKHWHEAQIVLGVMRSAMTVPQAYTAMRCYRPKPALVRQWARKVKNDGVGEKVTLRQWEVHLRIPGIRWWLTVFCLLRAHREAPARWGNPAGALSGKEEPPCSPGSG